MFGTTKARIRSSKRVRPVGSVVPLACVLLGTLAAGCSYSGPLVETASADAAKLPTGRTHGMLQESAHVESRPDAVGPQVPGSMPPDGPNPAAADVAGPEAVRGGSATPNPPRLAPVRKATVALPLDAEALAAWPHRAQAALTLNFPPRKPAPRRIAYLSESWASLVITVDGRSTAIDRDAQGESLEDTETGLQLKVLMEIGVGSRDVRAELFSSRGGTGDRLSVGTGKLEVQQGRQNTASIAMHGIAARLALCWDDEDEGEGECSSSRSVTTSANGSAWLTLRAYDASGALIDRDSYAKSAFVTTSDGSLSAAPAQEAGKRYAIGYQIRQSGAITIEARTSDDKDKIVTAKATLSLQAPLQEPVPPTNVYAYRNAGQPQGRSWNQNIITWSASGAGSFEVWCEAYRDGRLAVRGFLPESGLNGQSYTHSNLTAGTYCYYWVRGRNSAGTGGWSSYAWSLIPVPVYRFKRLLPDGRDTFCFGSTGDCSGYTKQFDHPVFAVSPDGTGAVSSLVSFEKAQDHILVQGSAEKISDRLALERAGYSRRILQGYAAAYSMSWLDRPLYRASSIRNGVGIHLFTLNSGEIQSGWSYEGVAAWVILP